MSSKERFSTEGGVVVWVEPTEEDPQDHPHAAPTENRAMASGKVYVDSPAEAPPGANVKRGPRGGYYYETTGVAKEGETEPTGEDVSSNELEQLPKQPALIGIEYMEDARDVMQNYGVGNNDMAAFERTVALLSERDIETEEDVMDVLDDAAREVWPDKEWARDMFIGMAASAINRAGRNAYRELFESATANMDFQSFTEAAWEGRNVMGMNNAMEAVEDRFERATDIPADDGKTVIYRWFDALGIIERVRSALLQDFPSGTLALTGIDDRVRESWFSSPKGQYNWDNQRVSINPDSAYDLETQIERFEEGGTSTPYRYHTVIHEMAHVFHSTILRKKFREGASITEMFRASTTWNSGEDERIARQVSEYAASDPMEFVAEYWSARVWDGGRGLIEEIYDPEVERLYEKYNGPRIPEGVELPDRGGLPSDQDTEEDNE